jgi:hypothetical protein
MLILQAGHQRHILGCPTHQELEHALEEMDSLQIYVFGYGESDGELTARNIRRFINKWIAQKPYARQDIGIYVTVTPLGKVDDKLSAVADLLETCNQMENIRSGTKMLGVVDTDANGEVDVQRFAESLVHSITSDAAMSSGRGELEHDDVDEDGFFPEEVEDANN